MPVRRRTGCEFVLLLFLLVRQRGVMASATPEAATLEYTPTWVVALVCSVIVVISLCVERFLHYLGKFLKNNRQPALFEALQKLKEELMLLGFISLMLTVFQGLISSICIPASLSYRMLPCKREVSGTGQMHYDKHFSEGLANNQKRLLSEGAGSGHCLSQGKVPLLSTEVLHHLHIFIFVLAVVHVLFCATTMVLGGAKIQRWKHWEDSIRNENLKNKKIKDHKHVHPHLEFVLMRSTGYWRRSAVVGWMISFFKQFHASVTKSDYIALRSGFIMKHCRSTPNFDFHKYMMRILEADFKKVVGISWYLWLFVVIFLLLDVDGWHTYFWLSFLPLVLLLTVGAKLEHIITRLAQDAAAQLTADDVGAMQVKPSDEHFWFHRPGLILYLIHFILFQNAFEIAFFFWILWTYGFDSCIMEKVGYVVPRLVIGVAIQVLCSYSTLPLYAIVTQMGEFFKEQIFNEQMQEAIHGWAADARGRKKSGTGLSSIFKSFSGKSKQNGAANDDVRKQMMLSEAVQSAHHTLDLEGTAVPASEISDSWQSS